MPPKVRTTKEDIINASMSIVRTKGVDALNARNVAALLNCSTQPIFSNFTTMDELKFAVIQKADELCREYTKREIDSGKYPIYKATGMAYIRFAKEEKELFKLMYMRDRSSENYPRELVIAPEIKSIVQSNTGLGEDDAKLFHFEIWAYVHGIATMLATNFLNLEWELISKMVTDSYNGLRKQYGME